MYYVVRVKYLKDGTEKRSELMAYETRNQAMSKFHQNLGADMADDTLNGSMCTVINDHGGQEAKEYWNNPTPAPEPEPSEEN